MPSTRKSYTPAEHALAEALFKRAAATGTLKPPRGLIAVAFSDGRTVSHSSPVTFRDYLADGRRELANRRARGSKRE